jgi:hypothetical protein
MLSFNNISSFVLWRCQIAFTRISKVKFQSNNDYATELLLQNGNASPKVVN